MSPASAVVPVSRLLMDDGKRLVTVNWLPKEKRQDFPPIISGQQTEIVQWDTHNWKQERTYPLTLQTVHWASYTPGEPWLVLAGNESTRGKMGSTPLTRTLQLSPMMGQEECHAAEKALQRGVQA